MSIRVLIVDDHAVVRAGLRLLLDAQDDIETVGEAGDAREAIFEARATRLSQAPDSAFVLAAGGTIRWVGEAVAKLTAGDNILRPRVRILSDEQLTGPARDTVQARLDLWLKAHLEKLLGPLFALATAEDITGIARGIAFQLTEALGVLER